VLLFCVQHTGVRYATAADEIDPDYGRALRRAQDGGVEVLAFGCRIEPNELSLSGPVPVRL
jgi:sugar fermentation stimulation protein A